MIKYLIAFLLIASPCLAGMGIGGFPQPGPGVVVAASGGGGETIGTATAGGVQVDADTGGRAYFWPISGTLTNNGALSSFTVTVRAQSGTRQIRLALYTGDSSTPNQYVAGSDTGWITYTAATDGTSITLASTSTPTLASGQQYWIGFRPIGYTKIYGTSGAGIAGKQAAIGTDVAWSDWSLLSIQADVGQHLPGKWQITTE